MKSPVYKQSNLKTMKKVITSIALMLAAAISNAQTTATNWTAMDCNGLSHTLFSQLDSGKVIVFAWVMPCGSCVNPSKTAYNAVQSFATSHPGKVRFYLADDLGDASCSTLSSWVTSNSVGSTANMKIFGNAGNVIDENDFGGTGMPHIIVMGGTSHTIYFNQKNSAANDATGITSAINSAIGITGISSVSNKMTFSILPNPGTELFSIMYEKAVKKVTVISIDGRVIMEDGYPNGKINPSVDLSQHAKGVYLIKVTDADNNTGMEKVIKQ